MTTTDTEQIIAAEQFLEHRLKGLQETLAQEDAARATRRQQIRDTAIKFGDENEIGESLDNLLVTLGLEPRTWQIQAMAVVRYSEDIMLPYALRHVPRGGSTPNPAAENWRPAYVGTGHSFTRPTITWCTMGYVGIEMSRTIDDGGNCYCDVIDHDDVIAKAREQVQEEYRVLVTGVEYAGCGGYECATNKATEALLLEEQRQQSARLAANRPEVDLF